MTTIARPAEQTNRLHASVLPSVPGLPWFGVVLASGLLTIIGTVIGGSDLTTGVPIELWAAFMAATVITTLAARRNAIFTAMVQPPLVLVFAIFFSAKILDGQSTVVVGVNVVNAFPMMVVGTAVALILGLGRIAAQPLRRPAARSSTAPREFGDLER